MFKEVFSKTEYIRAEFNKFLSDESNSKITNVALSVLAIFATSYLLVKCCSSKKNSIGVENQARIAKAREEESNLCYRERPKADLLKPFGPTKVLLPENREDLLQSIWPLRRLMESLYKGLPWPNSIRNLVVFTEVKGGLGDIAAAGKVIDLMKKIRPDLHIDWVLLGGFNKSFDPKMFLQNSSNVSVEKIIGESSKNRSCKDRDFLIMGPVKGSFSKEYVEGLTARKINGPVFNFLENGENLFFLSYRDGMFLFCMDSILKSGLNKNDLERRIYKNMFPVKGIRPDESIPMGLQQGSGVLLDQDLMKAPLSRGYCCPSYLSKIEDRSLRSDILCAMGSQAEPDYDQYSFNCGYAHREASWGKFIDCVAMHEKHKDVVVVLNQCGEFAKLSGYEFRKEVFTKERIALLKRLGYGNITFKDDGFFSTCLQKGEGRSLTVITRPKFMPKDMRRLQLASERILGTGDNSAVEAWCARCKLFLYEDVSNWNCKWKFLQQQVDLATSIYPALGRLLAIFGGDHRSDCKEFLNKPLDEAKMAELENLLNDPELSDATLAFCDQITSNYSFADILEGVLKRAAWHHCIPDLAQIEEQALDSDFYEQIVSYLKDKGRAPSSLEIGSVLRAQAQIEGTSSSLEMGSVLRAAAQICEVVETYEKKA